MWRNTRLVVLASVLAAIYAAALIPFKPITLLPGVTEVRPAVVLPVVFSLLFGPAAAWGAAIGNTIGDLFGSLGPGTLFGFVGNLLYGYIPYRIWNLWRESPPRFRSAADWLVFALAVLAAAAACALTVGWGVHVLGLFPFVYTAGIILGNNVLVAMVLGPPFLIAIYARVAKMNLLYSDLAGPATNGREARTVRRVLTIVLAAVAVAGLGAGFLATTAASSEAAIAGAAAPFLLAVLLVALVV